MKKSLLIVTTLVVGMLLGAVAMGTAFAAGPTPSTTPEPSAQGAGNGYGRGMMGLGRGSVGGEYGFEDEALTLLGMTREQVIAERQAGKSLVQIAQTKNVTEQQLVSTILAAKRADLDALVSAGKITQARADLMYKNMETAVPQAVNSTTTGSMRGNGNTNSGDCLMLDGTQKPETGQQFGRGGMMRGGRSNGPST